MGLGVVFIRPASAAPFGLRVLDPQDWSGSSGLARRNVAVVTSLQAEKRKVGSSYGWRATRFPNGQINDYSLISHACAGATREAMRILAHRRRPTPRQSALGRMCAAATCRRRMGSASSLDRDGPPGKTVPDTGTSNGTPTPSDRGPAGTHSDRPIRLVR